MPNQSRLALLALRSAIHNADMAARAELGQLAQEYDLTPDKRARRGDLTRERDIIAELAPKVWDLVPALACGTNHVIKCARLATRGKGISPLRWEPVIQAIKRIFVYPLDIRTQAS